MHKRIHKVIHKVTHKGEPRYLAERLSTGDRGREGVQPQRHVHDIRVNFNLGVAREGFMYRGAKLWNLLPVTLRCDKRISRFKTQSKIWIKKNIPALP